MKVSAAVLLIQDDIIAMINRNHHGRHNYLVPGCMVVAGNSQANAPAHETVHVSGMPGKIGPGDADIWYLRSPLYDYLVEPTHVQFGSGSVPEMVITSDPTNGISLTSWMDVTHSLAQLVAPKLMTEFVRRSLQNTWLEKPRNAPNRQFAAVS